MSIPPSAASPSTEPFPRPEIGDAKLAGTLDFLLEHLSRAPSACETTAEDFGQAAARMVLILARYYGGSSEAKQDEDRAKYAAALEAGAKHGYLAFEPRDGGGFCLKATAKAADLAKVQNEVQERLVAANPNDPYVRGPW